MEQHNTTNLEKILKESKGIEYLWKNIEKNKNGTKKALLAAENKLILEIDKVSKVLCKVPRLKMRGEDEKSTYEGTIYLCFNKDRKKTDEFIKRFPHWAILLAQELAATEHYKRLSNSNGIDISSEDDVKQFFNRKSKEQAKSIKGKASAAVKSIGKFFKNFGKMFTGRASKSGLEKKVKAFFALVNQPWRRWVEAVAEDGDKLDEKTARQKLEEKMNNSKHLADVFTVGDRNICNPEEMEILLHIIAKSINKKLISDVDKFKNKLVAVAEKEEQEKQKKMKEEEKERKRKEEEEKKNQKELEKQEELKKKKKLEEEEKKKEEKKKQEEKERLESIQFLNKELGKEANLDSMVGFIVSDESRSKKILENFKKLKNKDEILYILLNKIGLVQNREESKKLVNNIEQHEDENVKKLVEGLLRVIDSRLKDYKDEEQWAQEEKKETERIKKLISDIEKSNFVDFLKSIYGNDIGLILNILSQSADEALQKILIKLKVMHNNEKNDIIKGYKEERKSLVECLQKKLQDKNTISELENLKEQKVRKKLIDILDKYKIPSTDESQDYVGPDKVAALSKIAEDVLGKKYNDLVSEGWRSFMIPLGEKLGHKGDEVKGITKKGKCSSTDSDTSILCRIDMIIYANVGTLEYYNNCLPKLEVESSNNNNNNVESSNNINKKKKNKR